ncbi:MAG: type II secretion system protein [Rhodocyclaceae bacterium]
MQCLPACRHPSAQNPVQIRSERGFTLPELVTVMVVMSLLAAVAMPKFFTRSDFDVFGFKQEIQQSLRFAQKAAVAKRRMVCVAIASNTLTLQYATTYGAGSCNQNLIDPSTGSAYSQAAPSGVSITALSFNFDPLGKPSFSSAQTLNVTAGALTQSLIVEAETGYVR